MPTLSEVHVDQALTDYSAALFQDLGGSVASQAFSNRNVAQQSNNFHIYTAADLHRTDAQKRAPNTSAARKRYGLSTGQYFCDVWALAYDVSEQEVANQDAVLDAEQDAAKVIMEDLIMTEDNEWAATAFVTGVWGTSVAGATNFTQWDDAASTPIEDQRVGIRTVLSNTGKKPNKVVYGFQTWSDGLVDHPDLLDRIKHTQTGVVTEDLLAQVLGLDRVIVAETIRNSAQEGIAESAGFILGDNALLLHAPDNVGPRQATAGIRFNWSGLLGAASGVRTKRFDIPQDDAFPRVESDMAFDHHVQTAALGYALIDTIA
jgi:hypothetical protein